MRLETETKSRDSITASLSLGLETPKLQDSFLRVSVSKVSGLISVTKVTGLKKWFDKISIQRFFICCICR